MRHRLASLLLACLSALPATAEQLTIDRVVASPALSGAAPRGVEFSPDGTRVTYLERAASDASRRDLWAYDLTQRKPVLLLDSAEFAAVPESEEERARRERQRIPETGVTEYVWDSQGNAVLVPKSGDIWLKPLDGPVRRLTRTEGAETDPKFSPDGTHIAYVRDGNLYVQTLATGVERAITTDGGKNAILNGMAEFVAQEEMDRDTGYWWSPDGKSIAYARVDESRVPLVNRYDYGADGVKVIPQRYPFAGGPNVAIQLLVAPIDGSTSPVAIDLGPDADIYLARVNWKPDGGLAVQRMSRDQKRLDLLFADVKTGRTRVALTDTKSTWVDLHKDLYFLADGRFIWSSEQSGWRHLYLHDRFGKRLHAITRGKWPVTALAGVDAKAGTVMFTGQKDSPLERHVYTARLDGRDAGSPRRVSQGEGWHGAVLADAGGTWLDSFSSPTQPPQLSLRDRDGKVLTWLQENKVEGSHPYAPYLANHIQPVYGTLKAPDGETLHWSMLKPPGVDAANPAPAIIYTYGGPTSRVVTKAWGSRTALFLQALAQSGYVVFMLDNRGTPGQGKAFLDQIYNAFGTIESDDQALGAKYLKTLPFVKGERIGIYGHSYGGYNTLMSLLRHGDLYAAGVAAAPVSDWKLYDTFYTERFIGMPDAKGGVYDKGDATKLADKLSKPLLLIHGMADDNVFLDNSVRMAAALQQARKPFDMMFYPGERHGFYDTNLAAHYYLSAKAFFDRELKARSAD
ncbi:MAG: DPP IV N-terminal domain-containing protein [Niveispirillum sp.]|uniref:DPP IV N-terminal domain-containing protein n=1 Tax=Niveispirillum sp. TaxID=1917217 RepID=UPI004036BCBB